MTSEFKIDRPGVYKMRNGNRVPVWCNAGGCTVIEKLIVFFHDANDRYGLEDGFVLHASGEHFEQIADRHEGFAARYPIQETVPGGARIMVWEGERHRDRHWDSDDDPYFVGAWRPATALDLVDADLLIPDDRRTALRFFLKGDEDDDRISN